MLKVLSRAEGAKTDLTSIRCVFQSAIVGFKRLRKVATLALAMLLFASSAFADTNALPVSAALGEPVVLDPTDGIEWMPGQSLLPSWSWETRPGTSVAEFDDPAALRPVFTPDVAGTWVARLDLFDSSSPTSLITTLLLPISTENLAPVADILALGVPDGTTPLTLDGTGSYDVDGDALTYAWLVVDAPVGSSAAFNASDTSIVELSMDLEGTYTVGLTVQDASGNLSEQHELEASFFPFAGSTAVYRASYDTTFPAGGAGGTLFDIGDRSSGTGSNDLISAFRLDDGVATDADTLSVSLGGTTYTAVSPAEFLALIDLLIQDTDEATRVLVSSDETVGDLTLEFGGDNGSVTLQGILGVDLTRAEVIARGAGEYEGIGGRQVAPVASARFEQIRADVNTAVLIEPYASTDIDGSVLAGQTSLVYAPDGANVAISTDIDGLTTFQADLPGDYLIGISVEDEVRQSTDQVLIVVGDGNLRPVAQIADVRPAPPNTVLSIDGTQSYDFDGDLLNHQWSLLSAPVGSLVSLIDASAPKAELTPDLPGTYVVQLLVSDETANGIPVTKAIVVDAPFPIAEAGADILAGDNGQMQLDGTLSVGEQLTYAWSSIGLTGDGSSSEIVNGTTASPTVSLAIREGRFRDVIRLAPVYHFKRADTGGLCRFDVRLPDDVAGASSSEPIDITLHGRGRQDSASGEIQVWEIENKNLFTRDVTLEDDDGVVYGTWTVPGRVSIHVTTPNIANNDDMFALVGGVAYADDDRANNPFNRNNPVCTGPGAGVVQLIVSDANGFSRPDTVFIGNANLRPVLVGGPDIELGSGETASLSATALGFDGNGDALDYGWSLIARPDGSTATIDADPNIQIVPGETLAFTPDRAGLYLIQLTATDGEFEAHPVIILVEVVNSAPVASALTPADTFVGDVATLDGAASSDPDGDALSANWTIVSAPAGSTAGIADPFGVVTFFTPDVRGTYVFQLEVADFELSDTVQVVLNVPNRAPVAALGGPTEVTLGDETVYSALASSDADGDSLTYSFAVSSSPVGSNFVLADLVAGEVGLVADLAGDYTLEVTVSDGDLQAIQTLQITAIQGNSAPVLGALNGTYTVELGLELALDLTATDPEGDPISFFATPLPLASGITLDSANGEVRFRPEAGQIGTYTFTVGASDGSLTASSEITVEVVAGTASDTSVFGRVLDASDFANGVETPLVDMPVRLRDAGLMAVTDANGAFDFGSLSAGRDQIFIEPSANGGPGGYLSTSRIITVTENQNRDLAPDFLLTPLNDGCATVVTGVATVLTGTNSGVTVEIAADTIRDGAGALYTGDVCLGALPQLSQQPGFPDGTQACNIYGIDAPGASFTQGVTVTAPNNDLLPIGTRLRLQRQSAISGLFRSAANAFVDAGGTTVSATATGLSESTLFTFLPQAPRSVASSDQPTGNRALSVFEGDLNEVYTLPGYRAFNETQQVGLSYHSNAADPTIIVSGDVTIPDDASLPLTLSTLLDVGGLSVSDSDDWTPRTGIDGSTPALVGEELTVRQSMPLDASGFDSGRYDYDYQSQAAYACSTVSSEHSAEFYVQNETDSPYGRGWSIDGLQKLTVSPDGKVSIIDDDSVVTFDPEPTITNLEDEALVFPANGAVGLAVADFDGNGELDVAYGESGNGEISIVYNSSNRDLVKEDSISVADPTPVPETGVWGPNLAKISTGEIGRGEADDIAFVAQRQNRLGYLYGDGFGDFETRLRLNGSNLSVVDVEVVDMDGDGFDDIVFAGNIDSFFSTRTLIFVDFQGPNAELVTAADVSSRDFLQFETGDLNGDGRRDIAFRTRTSGVDPIGQVGPRDFIYENRTVGVNGSSNLGKYFRLADVNGDNRLDIIWSGTDRLDVYLNTTGFSWVLDNSLARPASASNAMFVNIVDTNGDGNTDIIATTTTEVAVYNGNGDGSFAPFEIGLIDYPIGELLVEDVDGDGSLDLISTQRFTVRVHFSKPNADGRFVAGAGEFSELTRLSDGTWERRYKNGMIVEFDASGLQIATVDPRGNRVEFAYGPDGRLLTKTDQVGGATLFAYQANGRLDSITYPDGRTTTMQYDDVNLASVIEPTGSSVQFQYNEDGRLVRTTNQNGNATDYSYDVTGKMRGASLPDGSSISNQVAASLGLVDGLGAAPSPRKFVEPDDRLTSVVDRKGQITEVQVNQFGSVIQVIDPLGRVTKMTRDEDDLVRRVERPSDAISGGVRVDTIDYDDRANVTAFAEALGTAEERTTVYEYEPVYNKVTRIVDPDGFETLYEYDSAGDVTKITDPEQGERGFVYLSDGRLGQRTDENGNSTDFLYITGTRNLGRIDYADGSMTTMDYDASGNATIIAEAQGTPIERQIQRTYDNLNRVLTVEVTAADGAQIDGVTTYTYEPNGNLATVTDETGLVTTMGYDELERLATVNDPAEGLITRTYNDAGEVIQHINGDGEIHAYLYDNVSRLTQTTDPEGFVKSFAYDIRDNIQTVTDGRGGLTQFGYDPLDRMTTRTNPINQTMTRAYDGRDNLTTLTREDGATETATYDGLKRRTQVVTPDNTLTYAYDPRSNLTEAADNDSRVTFTYDVRNRLETTTTDGTVGPQPQVTLTYTYDALDRRTSMSDSLGGTTTYAWDPEDRLTDLTAPWGTVYSFGYDGEGRRTSLTSTSGRNSTYGYTNGLLTALSHVQSGGSLTDLNYEYGVDGQLTAIVDNLDPSKSKAISYDQLNRLVQVAEGIPTSQGGTPIPVEDYAYDEEGNRTASHLSTLYSSNDHNQLEDDDDYTYAYDLKGNRVSRTSKATSDVETYTYDSQNRLVGYANPTTTASYAYDALDRRVGKTVDASTQAFVYDPWNPFSSIANDVLLDFIDGTLMTRWQHSTSIDEPLAFERYSGTTLPNSGSEHAMLSDRLGSIIKVIETATNTVTASAEYDAFGQRTGTGTPERYGFTGREHDGETGLIYFRARHYDPVTGQFIQRDPIGFAAGDLNLYAYVWNNPYNWTDPSGLSSTADYAVLGGTTLGVGYLIGATTGLGAAIGDLLSNINFSDIWNNEAPNESAEENPDSADQDEAPPPPPYYGPDDAEHILDNHAPGSGVPGKSEFPEGWSEEDILRAGEEIAKNGEEVPHGAHHPEDTLKEGTVNDVDIEVVVRPDGGITTLIPTGGEGVTVNPR